MISVAEWIDGYARAWREADAELVASLFTEEGAYYSDLFEAPALGHAGVEKYWREVTAVQSGVDLRLGEPIGDGSRVAVEFWTKMKVDGADVTLAGCMLLRFAPDGRAEELREYWAFRDGSHEPPKVWGR